MAEACLDAANAGYADCKKRDQSSIADSYTDDSSFMAIPVALLYFRSVELALKAVIMERGLASAEAIRSLPLGHNIKNLIGCATTLNSSGSQAFSLSELGLDQAASNLLQQFSDSYSKKWFEYHFGPWDIPPLIESQRIATSIVQATKPIARMGLIPKSTTKVKP